MYRAGGRPSQRSGSRRTPGPNQIGGSESSRTAASRSPARSGRDGRRRQQAFAALPRGQGGVGAEPLAGAQLAGPDLRGLAGRHHGDVKRRVEAEGGEGRRHQPAHRTQAGFVGGGTEPGQDGGEGEIPVEEVAAQRRQQVGGRGGAVGPAGQQDAGLLEQLPDEGESAGRVVGIDLATGEGVEAAEEAQGVGPADQEEFVAAGPAGQDDADGGQRVGGAHAPPSAAGASSSVLPLRPRSTASSSRSMANGLRM